MAIYQQQEPVKEEQRAERERVITVQLCYRCGSKEHKIQKCNKNNIFVTSNERRKMKEMRGVMEEIGEGKRLKLRLHPNYKRNEAMTSFSTEDEAQLTINRNCHLQRMESRIVKTNQKIKRI